MVDLTANRVGKIAEYKRGHYYLSHVEWEDGHAEIEVHHCVPKILWHSCDPKEWGKAQEMFKQLDVKDGPPPCLPEAEGSDPVPL